MKLTSEQLMITQETIQELIKQEIDAPMKDFTKISRLLKTIKEVDYLRRKTWHDEKFGVYEEIADSVFSSDDIPF